MFLEEPLRMDSGDEDEPRDEDVPMDEASRDEAEPTAEAPHNSPSPSSNSSGDTGYETDSNRSYLEEGADAMMSHPAQDIPDDILVGYINDLGEMAADNEY
jgi:hypothetical protein